MRPAELAAAEDVFDLVEEALVFCRCVLAGAEGGGELAEEFAQRVQDIEDRLDAWLDANLRRRTPSADLDRLDRHIREHPTSESLSFPAGSSSRSTLERRAPTPCMRPR